MNREQAWSTVSMRATFMLLVFTLLGLPGASADSLALQFGHDRFSFLQSQAFPGVGSREMRQGFDRDGDWTVDRGEVDFFTRAMTTTFEDTQQMRDCFKDVKFIVVGGKGIKGVSHIAVRFLGLEGPVNATKPIEIRAELGFRLYNTVSSPVIRMTMIDLDDIERLLACSTGFVGGWTDMWYGSRQSRISSEKSVWADQSTTASPSASSFDSVPTLKLEALAGYTIDPNSIRPDSVGSLWDGRAITADSEAELMAIAAQPVQFSLAGSILGAREEVPGWLWGSAVTASASAVGVGMFLTTEFGRFRFLKFLAAMGLFTRLEKDEVLEHDTREQLYQYIQKNPGPSFSDLRRALELSNGTLVHHLRILEMQEFIKSLRDGFRTRFYVRGPRIVPTAYLTRTQQTILEAIQGNPGVTQKELAQLLGLPRESVFYHARKLESAGSIKVNKEGKWRKYFPSTSAQPDSASMV